MVFHTAPPQPASKARMIISPVLVGGADASQNGFGQLIFPAKFRTPMSGMSNLRRFQHRSCGALAAGYCIHYLASAVDAIAAGKVARVARLPGFAVSHNPAVAHFYAAQLLQQLSER